MTSPRGLLWIIVVDDEPTIRSLILDAVEELGHKGIDARDAEIALETLRTASQVDVLMIDSTLADTDGREIASGARALRPRLKVVYLTGTDEETLRIERLEPGLSVLRKPFSLNQLKTALASLYQ